MQSIISRVSTNKQILLNPLQIIEIHNTGYALPNKTYLIDSLINTRGLIDSASLENHHNNRCYSGSHKWPKTFFWAVYVFVYFCISV